MTHTAVANPLLQGRGLPAFDKIQPTDVEPAVTTLVQELEAQLTELEEGILC
jgi:oligopeptidase A